MGTDQNKDVARRYYVRVPNDGELDLLDELAVETYESTTPFRARERDGRVSRTA